ncbi:hypothetical protein [Sporichthya sp.]|uniref:hypothetical protein n=1 Tax=Sporichthya sp. TaxID=65475 RepID=UPI0017DE3FBA|nr:hypothetical protein [Sporichthya sp.]MBA3744177.1 hypothetical protein [Sporichthya sp.]
MELIRTSLWFRAAALVATVTVVVAAATVSGSATAGAPAAPTAAEVNAGETVSVVRLGPFVLPSAPTGEMQVNRPLPNVPKPCEDCYITAIEPRLVTADGKRADMSTGVMMHHFVVAETAATDPTCGRNGIGAMGRRLFASGDERTPIRLPDGFGFRVRPGPWAGLIELMNHSETPQVVFFETVVHHVPASTPGMKAVTPVWLDVNNCMTSEYAVPTGKSATAWSWRSSLTGRVVAAGGHVHAGGMGMTLDNVTTKARICSSRAGYGSGALDGLVTSMSTCSWDSLGALRAGDKLTLTSMYDAPKAMGDVMGIMLIAVYETDEVDGGTTAPAWMGRNPQTHVPGGAGHDHGGGGPGH